MTIKEIREGLEEGESLKIIAQTYSDIANLKIKRIRGLVEKNRYFFEEIAKVYSLIKKIAEQRKISYKKPKGTVSVIITSNYKFYGSINSNLINFFVSTIRSLNTDTILLGRVAIDYFKASHTLNNYREILLKTDQPSAAELTNLIEVIKPYNQVLIFHSKLKSILTQEPSVTDITATSTTLSSKDYRKVGFIFEPELSKILSFFDSQILTLLLESTFLESELSRTASRFISMDSAENEANKFIQEYKMLQAYTKKSITNIQILENFAAIAASKGGYESS